MLLFPGGTHRMTSDEFFATNDRHFDVIFVDGLHESEQVLKDVSAALDILNPNGFVFMHDCNPRFQEIQVRPRRNVLWTVSLSFHLIIALQHLHFFYKLPEYVFSPNLFDYNYAFFLFFF